MVKIVLHGKLAEVAGQTNWYLDVQTAAEALRAVDANCGGRVREYLATNLHTEYRVLLNEQDSRSERDIVNPHQKLSKVEILPVLSGAGSGLFQLFAAVVLIALAWVVAPLAAGGSVGIFGSGAAVTGGMAGLSVFLQTAALAMAVGGISSLVAGDPTLPSFQSNERPENKPSYLFSGAVNTTQQGNPVPIGYGRLRVGSQVVSAGIRSVEFPIT